MHFQRAILLLACTSFLLTLSAPAPNFSTNTYGISTIDRRATPIPIGYTGTDNEQAAQYEKKAARTSNHVARLGTGLYLTDSYRLALKFAENAKVASQRKRRKTLELKVCVVYAKESEWIARPKIWIPDDLVNPNPAAAVEQKRVDYVAASGVKNPAVRFAAYNIGNYVGNELVIPPDLQEGLSAKCWDPIAVTSMQNLNADESLPEGMPDLKVNYDEVVKKWKIVKPDVK